MRSTFLKTILRTAALAGAGVLLTAGVSSAATVTSTSRRRAPRRRCRAASTRSRCGCFVCDPATPSQPQLRAVGLGIAADQRRRRATP